MSNEKQHSIKRKILILTLLPLILVSLSITGIALFYMNRFGQETIEAMQKHMLNQRETELANYTSIAVTAIAATKEDRSLTTKAAQEQAKDILRGIEYGEDGYFFVYDYRGINLAHPKKPHLEGKNLISLKDSGGVKVIEELINAARKNGDTVSYMWDKPSVGREVQKVGYALGLQDWKWMIGTGLYMDDIERAQTVLRSDLRGNLTNTVYLLVGISLFAVIAIGTLSGRITVSEGSMADQQIRMLSRRTREVQESERSEISRYLKSHVLGYVNETKQILNKLDETTAQTPGKVASAVNRAQASLTTTAKSIESLSSRLRPTELDQQGLFAAIKTLLKNYKSRSDSEVSFNVPSTPIRLPETVETKLYRISEELIDNIEQHSQASEVNLRFRAYDRSISFSVKDNGVGITDEAMNDPSKTGLVGVRDQVESMNGKVSLITAKGAGTLIRISVPL